MIRTILAAAASAVIMFVWGILSWSMIGWHQPRDFKNQEEVTRVLKANADEHAVYAYPSWNAGAGASEEEQAAIFEALMKQWEEGPFIHAIIRPGPRPNYSIARPMLRQLGICVLASITLVFLIQKARHTAFLDRLSMAVLAGLLVGILGSLPSWNWMEMPGRDTLASLLDGIIQMSLAGAAIAVILPRRE